MLSDATKLHLYRVVIETQSPMAIHSGYRETGFDNSLVRDINGLPMIPATAIAGVWRHFCDEHTAAQWFGHQDKKGSLTISHGRVHNSQNQPVSGLLDNAAAKKDSLLQLLLKASPANRERVRINPRGVATNEGKFDQITLPTGVRFSFDLRWYETNSKQPEQFKTLLSLLNHPAFALGSSTRNGMGRFKIVGLSSEYELVGDQPAMAKMLTDFASFTHIPVTVDNDSFESTVSQPFARLSIKADSTWVCGQGTESLLAEPQNNTNNTALTYSERYIEWESNQCTGLSQFPVPIISGSSIKGMIAHRLAFHYRRHSCLWAEKADDDEFIGKRPQPLTELLGSEDTNSPYAGKLWVLDSAVNSEQYIVRPHNSIDRFTGGVINKVLFSEELLYKPSFTLTLMLSENARCSDTLKKALSDTLNDIKTGRLSIGAKTGRGTSLTQCDPNGVWEINWNQLEVLEQQEKESHESA